jgi:hypothetical protein
MSFTLPGIDVPGYRLCRPCGTGFVTAGSLKSETWASHSKFIRAIFIADSFAWSGPPIRKSEGGTAFRPYPLHSLRNLMLSFFLPASLLRDPR